MPPRKPTPASLKVEKWVIVHRPMMEWERQELQGMCAMVGAHGGKLVPWPCPEAPSEDATPKK